MGTKNSPGEYDCYAKAEPDEPMFTLLGRDPSAGVLVWTWAAIQYNLGQGDSPKVREAADCGEAMIRWTMKQGKSPSGLLALIKALCTIAEGTGCQVTLTPLEGGSHSINLQMPENAHTMMAEAVKAARQ